MNHLKPPGERPHRAHTPDQSPNKQRVSLERSPHPYYRRSDSIRQHAAGKPSPPTSQPTSRSESTESGTEADDEKGAILRGLPAPPIRSHKGLRGSTPRGLSPAASPLPTPSAAKDKAFFETAADQQAPNRAEERRKQEAYLKRKKAEVVRRITETVLLGTICILIWQSAGGSKQLKPWLAEFLVFIAVPTCLYSFYPLRRAYLEVTRGRTITEAVSKGYYIPSRFDPGSLFYPVILPTAIALSLYGHEASYLPTSLVCGLSSIPEGVTDIYDRPQLSWYLRWWLTVVPFPEVYRLLGSVVDVRPTALKPGGISREQLILIFPLHRALHRVLRYLTTTSLDPAELELLATGLIHLHMFAGSPQAQILKAVIWVGGLSIFVTCRQLMAWEVELARIPRWKFAKIPHKSALSHRLQRAFSAFMSEPIPTSESSDDEIDNRAKPQPRSLQRVKTLAESVSSPKASINGILRPTRRRATLSDLDPATIQAERRSQRNKQYQASPFLALTAQQATIRKYFYAAIVYLLVLLIILLPVRHYVGVRALHGYEPFGWAVGYLFGNIPQLRDWVYRLGLTGWIQLPDRATTDDGSFATLTDLLIMLLQPANSRLALGAYCIIVIGLGIIIVLQLTSYVEVDTRRKVFHGVMVFMLLPTIFVDPCFFALALALILAVFLLLDLFRASQLPPISRPLTTFLAPYVDGRDHRGPVIVSHIFLLIGCAIPLWLSLAGLPRSGTDPWKGWEVSTRDVSMTTGVVCVGMGDAAASLIGRRYGRTKWYWGGGKSLEGSFAFAVAVTVGLFLAWAWVRIGGWTPWTEGWLETMLVIGKCAIAASGASLLESVLTAANDNVVVPVGLWLLVRGLEI